MIVVMKYKKGKMTPRKISEALLNHMYSFFRQKEHNLEYGRENIVSGVDLKKEIRMFLSKYVVDEYKLKGIEYELFIERRYGWVMSRLMDTSDKNKYRVAGLLNEPRIGYFIAKTVEEVEWNTVIKQNSITSKQIALGQRSMLAVQNVKLLESGKKPEELPEHKDDIDWDLDIDGKEVK